MIKFGISENYVPNWGIVQAIREIYQNFIDYGDFNVSLEDIDTNRCLITISNDFVPENWEFLKIGFSAKKDGAIGKHGEGLKLAGLVFKRNNCSFKIKTQIGKAEPTFYEDAKLGSCYGLEINEGCSDNFEISFEANTKDIDIFNEGYIKDDHILHESIYGSIVAKKKGNIYVGGLYVCHLPDLKYAFNFSPDYVDLGRDRNFPSTFDLEYYMNKIINSCSKDLKFKATDINDREFNVGEIPIKLSSKFYPAYSENGKIQMISGKTIITDSGIVKKISKNPVVAKRIEKLRYVATFKTKKSPTTILKEFKNSLILDAEEKVRFDSIIKLSRNWKNK